MLRFKIWKESVALFQIDNRENFVFKLHLWVMKEYGAVKSWTKLDNNSVLFKRYCPIPLGSMAVMNW